MNSGPGKVVSSRARARSTGPLRFHTDHCDVITLMCLRNGIEGGVWRLAPIPTIHDEMLRRHQDLVALFQDCWRCRPKDEDGGFAQPYFALPVWGVRDGKITSQYSRTYVEQAQEFAELPRLTAAQNEALDLLAEIAEATCLYSPFAPGDIQLLNNHVVYHGRTAYADDAAAGRIAAADPAVAGDAEQPRVAGGIRDVLGQHRTRRAARRRAATRRTAHAAAGNAAARGRLRLAALFASPCAWWWR